jgi:hypothetical protein
MVQRLGAPPKLQAAYYAFMWCIGPKVQAFAACYPHSPHGNSPKPGAAGLARGTKKKPNVRIDGR